MDVAAVVDRLRLAGCLAAEEEADLLLAAGPDAALLERWLTRRERGEPLAWIIGSTEFCGRPLVVHPGVYVPRPQTEALAERAALLVAAGDRLADLCTGVGAIAAHVRAEVPGAVVVGVDIDPGAVRCARANGVPALVGDLGDALRPAVFDVVTAVVPYVPSGELAVLPADVVAFEPLVALDGGPDGLDVARRVVEASARLLRPGGWLLAELGGEQHDGLVPCLVDNGFEPPVPWFDDDGDLRGIEARMGRLPEEGRDGDR